MGSELCRFNAVGGANSIALMWHVASFAACCCNLLVLEAELSQHGTYGPAQTYCAAHSQHVHLCAGYNVFITLNGNLALTIASYGG